MYPILTEMLTPMYVFHKNTTTITIKDLCNLLLPFIVLQRNRPLLVKGPYCEQTSVT